LTGYFALADGYQNTQSLSRKSSSSCGKTIAQDARLHELTAVPYKGGGPIVLALVSGEIQVTAVGLGNTRAHDSLSLRGVPESGPGMGCNADQARAAAAPLTRSFRVAARQRRWARSERVKKALIVNWRRAVGQGQLSAGRKSASASKPTIP
jgi:hypothetical protein